MISQVTGSIWRQTMKTLLQPYPPSARTPRKGLRGWRSWRHRSASSKHDQLNPARNASKTAAGPLRDPLEHLWPFKQYQRVKHQNKNMVKISWYFRVPDFAWRNANLEPCGCPKTLRTTIGSQKICTSRSYSLEIFHPHNRILFRWSSILLHTIICTHAVRSLN